MEQPMDIGNIMGNVSNWLVVWNMNFMTSHSVGNVIIPTVTHSLHHFSEGWVEPPTNQEWGYIMGI